jgi:hypothetical protein
VVNRDKPNRLFPRGKQIPDIGPVFVYAIVDNEYNRVVIIPPNQLVEEVTLVKSRTVRHIDNKGSQVISTGRFESESRLSHPSFTN